MSPRRMKKKTRTERKPTPEGAIRIIRTDPDARLAVVVAAAFAWSMGFALGFLIGEREGAGPGAVRSTDDA